MTDRMAFQVTTHGWEVRPFAHSSLALAASFTIEAVLSAKRPDIAIVADVEVSEAGRPEVKSLRMVAEGTAAVEPRDLRFPLRRFVQRALPLAARVVTHDGDRTTIQPLTKAHEADLRKAIAQAFEPVPRAGARQAMTPDRLRKVATAYREAIKADIPPTQAVADRLGVGRPHAGRLVQRARTEKDPMTGRPYLGPTRRGKAGEVEQ